MNGKEIIRRIKEIYKHFAVPPNLQNHSISAASVGELVADNWKGSEINKEDLVAYLLLHDLGNIVKFDFAHKELFTQDMRDNIEYWKLVQKNARRRCGFSSRDATIVMAGELGLSQRIAALLEHTDFGNLDHIVAGKDWEKKIGHYSDCRSGPYGVVPLADRMVDLRRRYTGKALIAHDPKLEYLEGSITLIEKQIFSNTTIKPEDINEEGIKKYLDKYQSTFSNAPCLLDVNNAKCLVND